MKNAKLNIAFPAFGFLLSLIVGIITRASFGVLLLRAIIFAVLFAAISIAIQLLFKTVLSVSGEEQSDSLGGGEDKAVGSVVDITLPDEDLPTVPNAPTFNVGSNHQMLNESDYNKPRAPEAVFSSKPIAAQPSGGVSAQASSSSPDASSGVGFVAAPLENVAQSSAQQTGNIDNNGELPALSDLHIGDDDDGPVVEDADLPDDNVSVLPKSSASKSANTNIDNKDTVLMARAISTVLANDSN